MDETPNTDVTELLDHARAWGRAAARRIATWARAHRAATAGIGVAFVAVLLAIVFAASLSSSVHRIHQDADQLSSTYSELAVHLAGGNPDAAQQDAQRTTELSAHMDKEAASWTWSVASALPVVGSDARAVRTLANTAKRLSQEAVEPLVTTYAEQARAGSAQGGNTGLLDVFTGAETSSALLEKLRTVQPVVSECNEAVQGVEQPHSKELQQTLETLQAGLGALNTGLSNLDTALATSDLIGDTISTLLP